MLREELYDGDILHQTHICQCIDEIWENHISDLKDEMKVQISFCFVQNLADLEQLSEFPWKNFLDIWPVEQQQLNTVYGCDCLLDPGQNNYNTTRAPI